jgi:hypothetical protein
MIKNIDEIVQRLQQNKTDSIAVIGDALFTSFEKKLSEVFDSTALCSWSDLRVTFYHIAKVNRADIKAYINPKLLQYGLHVADLDVSESKFNADDIKFGFGDGRPLYGMTVKSLAPLEKNTP